MPLLRFVWGHAAVLGRRLLPALRGASPIGLHKGVVSGGVILVALGLQDRLERGVGFFIVLARRVVKGGLPLRGRGRRRFLSLRYACGRPRASHLRAWFVRLAQRLWSLAAVTLAVTPGLA